MGEKPLSDFFLSLALTGFLIVMAIFLIIVSFRRRQLLFVKEKEDSEFRHEQQLLEARQEIQQNLMQHLGGELHDTIGQKLTLVYLQMENTRYLNDIDAVKEQIESQSNLIRDSLDELRSLSKILVSHDFSDFSFVHFLEKEMNRLAQSGLCTAVFVSPENYHPCDERVELTLARICQEFIQNSLRHSSCTTIKIEIKPLADTLEIYCSDNGNGIDWKNINSYKVNSGSGLLTINSRIQSINAQCEWRNDNGTSLMIRVPLRKSLAYET
ncbi:MAG TPA: ATP-binding protein [Chitinophagaceae bacterium]